VGEGSSPRSNTGAEDDSRNSPDASCGRPVFRAGSRGRSPRRRATHPSIERTIWWLLAGAFPPPNAVGGHWGHARSYLLALSCRGHAAEAIPTKYRSASYFGQICVDGLRSVSDAWLPYYRGRYHLWSGPSLHPGLRYRQRTGPHCHERESAPIRDTARKTERSYCNYVASAYPGPLVLSQEGWYGMGLLLRFSPCASWQAIPFRY